MNSQRFLMLGDWETSIYDVDIVIQHIKEDWTGIGSSVHSIRLTEFNYKRSALER